MKSAFGPFKEPQLKSIGLLIVKRLFIHKIRCQGAHTVFCDIREWMTYPEIITKNVILVDISKLSPETSTLVKSQLLSLTLGSKTSLEVENRRSYQGEQMGIKEDGLYRRYLVESKRNCNRMKRTELHL